jgi:hypothetical protein
VQRVSLQGRQRTLKSHRMLSSTTKLPHDVKAPSGVRLLPWAFLLCTNEIRKEGVVIIRFGDLVACFVHAMLNREGCCHARDSSHEVRTSSDDEEWVGVARGGKESLVRWLSVSRVLAGGRV